MQFQQNVGFDLYDRPSQGLLNAYPTGIGAPNKYLCEFHESIVFFVVHSVELLLAPLNSLTNNVPFVLSKNLILAIGIVPSSVVAEVTFENHYSLKNLQDLGYEIKTWYQKDENIKRHILLKKI